MAKKSKEQISYNMSQVRHTNSALEKAFANELTRRGVISYSKNDKTILGKPDFVFKARRIAVFCDSELWHGFDWENTSKTIKTNRDFWIPKIERNIKRDEEVSEKLSADGWTVLRFWEHQIRNSITVCVDRVISALRLPMPYAPFRTIDLCAGIGGIRRGFEMTGFFRNVLSAENDAWACKTYEHIFGNNPDNDVTSEEFKLLVERTPYDDLLAGFPCQTFSDRNDLTGTIAFWRTEMAA